jgi:ParB family transcriptional regulator, chromosome partitioning protein
MSDNKQVSKAHPKKPSLGRGLGSLLGGDEGAFSKTTAATSTAEVLGKSLPSQSIPPIRAGILEKPLDAATTPKPSPAPIAAAPNVELAPTPVVAQVAPAELTPSPVLTKPEPATPKIPDTQRIWQIAIENLKPNPKQPRQVFDKEPLDELAASIKEKGIIQPLLARKMPDGKFQIIAGERRWRAAQIADLKEVPVILKTIDDGETQELALIENIQRQDLNPIEEAEAYDFLMKNYKLTQTELAERVGKERATVANVLRLLNLYPEVRLMVSVGEIALGQAKVLLAISDEDQQIELADRVKKENLSVRALEKIVTRIKDGAPPAIEPKKEDLHLKVLQEELQKIIGSKVVLDYSSGKGRLSLHFYSDDELNEMAERIRDSWLN